MVAVVRAGRRMLVALVFLVLATNARAADLTADSLVVRGNVEFARGYLGSAATWYERALRLDPRYAPAAAGLGQVSVERGNIDEAERLFRQAEEWEPGKGYLEFGEALIAQSRGDGTTAGWKFRVASRKNPRNAEALVHLARIFVSLGERGRAKESFRKAVEADPRHPSAHLELAWLYERDGDLANAITQYEAHVQIMPPDKDTLTRLGYCLLERGRYSQARQRLHEALDLAYGQDRDLLLAVAASCVSDREFELAADAYAKAMGRMSAGERFWYEDLTNVASPEEVRQLRNLSGEAQAEFVRMFWLRHDPTPATELNERKLEHYRRVWYARRYFSHGRKPWDDRGSVYIRYGPPKHRASKFNPNFAMGSDVEMAREHLRYNIYGSRAHSMGGSPEGTAFPLAFSDEEARLITDWEEWVYPTVKKGLVILFSERNNDGNYCFHTPPILHTPFHLLPVLYQYAPEEQYHAAQLDKPDRYIYDEAHDPLDFAYYLAQFRAPNGNTELDIYYGLPTAELQFRTNSEGTFTAALERGYALFDTAWHVETRSVEHVELRASSDPQREKGAIHVDSQSLLLPGGEDVLLSVQARDLISGRLGAYREKVEVARFDSAHLAMSDIVLAGSIRKADSTGSQKFVRNGLLILPMATQTFRRGQPIHLYFEIYNLTRGERYGETEYEVEHAVRTGREAERGSVLRAIGRFLGIRRRVGVSRIYEGIRTAETQHFQLGTSTLDKGDYTLVITVRDLKSGKEVAGERAFQITE